MSILGSIKELDLLIDSESTVAVFFLSSNDSGVSKQLNQLIPEFEDEFKNIKFAKCTDPSIAEFAKVSVFPAILYFHMKKPWHAESATVSNSVNSVKVIVEDLTKLNSLRMDPLEERLKRLLAQSKVMLFMKGSKKNPVCQFSKAIVGLLNSINCDYETFDILSDESVRQGLKLYSNWPTYPQLYCEGQLIGGVDIVKELLAEGELKKELKMV